MMKKKMLWRRATSVMLGGLLCASLATVGCTQRSAGGDGILTYGINVLASKTDVAIAVPRGNEVVFSADVFARNLNLSDIESITVCSLPKDTEGELLLGSTRVAVGQRISRANLSYLTFAAASEHVTNASFCFAANDRGVPMVCRMYLLDKENATPTLSMVPSLSLNVFTYRGHAAHGTLGAYDPDGDEMVFEIVSYPQYGSLRMIDTTVGSYVYMPQEDFTGTDSFSYVARDQYGNYSASATVNVRVEHSGTSVTYTDVGEGRTYNAALALTEAGIMSGTQVGNQHFFYPDRTVTRAEFLVMAMNAAGITDVPSCDATAFADDESISKSIKGYVAAAYTMGIISGTNVQGDLCFLPDEEITRAQAAVILEHLLDLSDTRVVAVFADHSKIPVWASDALYSLHAEGILSADGGYISPCAKITRAETAEALCSVMKYVK